MKLEYKILWLDDQIQDFIDDEMIQEVEEYLIEQGFQPKIITVSKSEDFFKSLDDSFDLILTDYHLNDINGDEVIKKIRSQEFSVLSEVLFYTAKADLKDTDKINRVSFLETNTLLGDHRDLVLQATISLIGLTLKKFQNIIAMRGMIMHETSSLDVEMIEIIKKALKNESLNFEELSVSIYDQLIDLFTKKTEFVQECKRKMNFNQLTKDNFVYSAKYKILTLSKILEDLKMADFSSEYDSEINSIRNKFAHAVLEKDENGREFFKHKEDGIDFNEDLCKVIRENIVKHKSNLDELKERI
ncbi:response regulator [Carboxylicivirga sp. A043]|uniref:response regulator n=1 Tax=Carboxylicivirga litoralis TaxID=2816963 RepID=UPI0021CB8F2D|nr:response regulator [Carboxylicivirga sp. A043]MCU4158399.1 response regulator [Carboxylicivirga sp. A043]